MRLMGNSTNVLPLLREDAETGTQAPHIQALAFDRFDSSKCGLLRQSYPCNALTHLLALDASRSQPEPHSSLIA